MSKEWVLARGCLKGTGCIYKNRSEATSGTFFQVAVLSLPEKYSDSHSFCVLKQRQDIESKTVCALNDIREMRNNTSSKGRLEDYIKN